MTRRFIVEFTEREQIDQVFLVADKQLRANRQGNFYLQFRLADKSGSITGMLWNANEKLFGSVCFHSTADPSRGDDDANFHDE